MKHWRVLSIHLLAKYLSAEAASLYYNIDSFQLCDDVSVGRYWSLNSLKASKSFTMAMATVGSSDKEVTKLGPLQWLTIGAYGNINSVLKVMYYILRTTL